MLSKQISCILALFSLAVFVCLLDAPFIEARHVPRMSHNHGQLSEESHVQRIGVRCERPIQAPPSSSIAPAPTSTAVSASSASALLSRSPLVAPVSTPNATPTSLPSVPSSSPSRSPSSPPAGSPSSPPAGSPSSPPAGPPSSPPAGSPSPLPTSQLASPGGKGGLCWGGGDANAVALFKGGNIRYLYGWSPDYPYSRDDFQRMLPEIKFMPMLWGRQHTTEFERAVVSGYATIALGMNEPDFAGQADMSPTEGKTLWIRYLRPLRSQGYQLGSPATTNGEGGKRWMRQFLDACALEGGCQWDYLCLHWYGLDATNFQTYVQEMHAEFPGGVMITEFACTDFTFREVCDTYAFNARMKPWLDSQDYITAYFPFGAFQDMNNVHVANRLVDGNNRPNDLGKKWFDIP